MPPVVIGKTKRHEAQADHDGGGGDISGRTFLTGA
jgi:hypothetical protein